MYISHRLKNSGCCAAALLSLLAVPMWAEAAPEHPMTPRQAQEKPQQKSRLLQGQVVDEHNESLIGVTIQVEGTQEKTVTDIDGNYRIHVPKGAACKVVFSYVGMETQVLSVGKDEETTTGNVVMRSSQELEAVVVTGFYTRSKETFTGAAQTIRGDDLRKVSPTNIMQALSTLDAGITIGQNNAGGSNPNVIPDLVVRSTTSLATGQESGLNSPLIVIDGVERSLQALYDIDINDIERVDILKDASATALYGENAANGVIVVERKRVSRSPVKVRYTFTPTVSFADLSSYDLCNAAQKLELERRAGLYTSPDGKLDQGYYDKLALVSSGINTDWIAKPVRNSFSHAHSVSVSGRGQGLDYNVNGSYANTQGVMRNDGRSRYGMDIYLSYRQVENLILTLRAGHNELNVKTSNYGAFSDYTQANPYDSPFDDHGNLRRRLSYGRNNPLYEALLSSFAKSESQTNELSLDLRYNFKPTLFVTAQGSYNTSRGTGDTYISPESNLYAAISDNTRKGRYVLENKGSENWGAKVVGNWIINLDDAGSMLTLNAGGEAKRQRSYLRSLEGTGFLSDNQSDISYATSYPDSRPKGNESIATSLGIFVSGNYAYRMRYFVDGSYRLSGSSKFGKNNRYAPFWSGGMGWNLHHEPFVKKLGWVSTLRLRASYGYTGSVKFSSYQAVTTYHYTNDYVHYSGVGAVPLGMSNPDLTWQTTKKANIGMVSALFNDRLNLNLDYYHENTDDMLIDMSLPPSSGATSVKSNIGRQMSSGVEFSIWGRLVDNKDWTLTATLNGLHSKTTILGISDALKRWNEKNAADNKYAAPRLQFREGESPTAIYAVRSAGIDPASGKEIFIKKDGSYTYDYSTKDLVNCGDANPLLQGSFSAQLRWKRLYLMAGFSYRLGGDMYNSTRASKIENIDPQKNADVRALTDRWHKPGDVVPYLNISTEGGKSFVYTDRFVEKDNELLFSSLQLRYDMPDEWSKKIFAEKVYVSVGTSDLFRLTSAKYERGTSYPYSRSINFTFNISF